MSDIREANRAFIAAGRYVRSGPQFFLSLPLTAAARYVQDAYETARKEREAIERSRKGRR